MLERKRKEHHSLLKPFVWSQCNRYLDWSLSVGVDLADPLRLLTTCAASMVGRGGTKFKGGVVNFQLQQHLVRQKKSCIASSLSLGQQGHQATEMVDGILMAKLSDLCGARPITYKITALIQSGVVILCHGRSSSALVRIKWLC